MFAHSTQHKFFFIAAPIALISIVAVAVWDLHREYDDHLDRLLFKLEHLVQNQTIVLSTVLAKRENRLIKLKSAGLVADPEIDYVRVQDASGLDISHLGKPPIKGKVRTRTIWIARDGAIENGGSVSIGVTYKRALNAFYSGIWRSCISVLVAIGAIWLGGFVAFRHIVGRPLKRLHDMIASWRSNISSQSPEIFTKDEFGSLTKAFVELRSEITTRENELKATKEGLELAVKERTSELEHRASHDALTELLDRQAAAEYGERSLAVAKKYGDNIALVMVDLDRFKEVNDSYGHAAGDHVLKEVGNRLRSLVRKGDKVARMGGDEFLIIVQSGHQDALHKLGRRIVAQVAEPIKFESICCRIGASVGIAISSQSSNDMNELLASADMALYDAKSNGRGTVRFFTYSIAEVYRQRRNIVEAVVKAVERRDFEPYFQPQLSLLTGDLVGFELLARWRTEDGNIKLPSHFLDAASEAGVIAEIDLIILEKGLDSLVSMRAAGLDVSRVSINASEALLRRSNLVDVIGEELIKRDLRPVDLAVEILEETMIDDIEDKAAKTIQSLHKLGVRIELDDFGTGYAALSNLATLNLTAIKLDRSLIKPLPGGANEQIVRAMVALCNELNIQIVAEGAESEAQFELLRVLGCDFIQGYTISKPMNFKTAVNWAMTRRAGEDLTQRVA